tara:strand:+ start:644 stop:889 length:246 start_codon:yes stop_codon:yes gene_type:complete
MNESYAHSYSSPSRKCIVCGGLLSRRNQKHVKLKICYKCKQNVDALPLKFRCKGINKLGQRCRFVTQGYCTYHKDQAGEEE